jgi:F-type H+-transporting ATPase subunit b
MDINITLLGEMITFAIFVWFTMRFVWPPITKVIQAREDQIAEGIAKTKQGEKDLVLARDKAIAMLKEAKGDAAELLERANQRADALMREAKDASAHEATRLIEAAQAEVRQAVLSAKEQLKQQAVEISSEIAGKMLTGLDEAQQQALLKEALKEGG